MDTQEKINPELLKGPISWMARNPVAANLLMIILMAGGLLMSGRIKQEVFPEFELDIIQIVVPYPGASPEEVEQGILLAVEEEIRGLNDIKKITATAQEGAGVVSVELITGADSDKNLNDIKSYVDRITSFPEDAERPVVQLLTNRREVVSLLLYGDLDEETLRQLAEQTREALLIDPGITQVDLDGVRDREISVEISQDNLRRHRLSLEEVANRVRAASIELPGGGLKTSGGELLLRTDERRDLGPELRNIELRSDPAGGVVRLGDVASIRDGFSEQDLLSFFEGKPAVRVTVFRVGDQTPITVSDAVKDYMEREEPNLPPGVKMAIWSDQSEIYKDRIDLLMRNALMGLILVFAVLGLFLHFELAFWVTMGIPISFLGAMLLMPAMGVSINMISLFAFIIVLGIVVDDAIVVGENIYERRQQGMSVAEAALQGAREISVPVVFSVLTTVAAFSPLFFVPGIFGKIFGVIPAIVIAVLAISLFESLFILPAHLSHRFSPFVMLEEAWRGITGRRRSAQETDGDARATSSLTGRALDWFILRAYRPSVEFAMRWRYLTFGASVALFIATIGIVAGGHIQFTFFPKLDGDVVTVRARLPIGAPFEDGFAIRERIEAGLKTVIANNGGDAIKRGQLTQLGQSIRGGGPRSGGSTNGSNIIDVAIFMVPTDQRPIIASEFAKQWRVAMGDLPGLDSITFDFTTGPSAGLPIDVQLSHRDNDTLERAAARMAAELRAYNVRDIEDGFDNGKPQLNFTLTPEALSLGFTEQALARQLRGAFFGVEALRQQRGRDEVRTYVRLPLADRRNAKTLDELLLRTPRGGELPLGVATERALDRAPTVIKRIDGRRVINVTADIEPGAANANEIVASLRQKVMPGLLNDYPNLTYSLEGEQREQAESMKSLGQGMLVGLLIIYILLAIPFKSYIQPMIIMSAIPFGIVGAVIGHVALGYELSIMSMMGIVALTGIVVNDSLVLIDAINQLRRDGLPLYDAVRDAGARRFRPILLTSLTTFFGLIPMVLETSVQARFLIPMAVSLAFGVMFSTFVILLLVPALYLILEDILSLGDRLRAPFIKKRPVSDDDEERAAQTQRLA
jgi:multidrug efflux pump subunit AcrB